MRSPAANGPARSKAAKPPGRAAKTVTRPAAKPTYSIDVLEKTFDLLDVFTHQTPSLTLRDVAARTGLPKTTVFRILSTLVHRSICEFDERTGEYSLGFVFLRFAEIRRRQSNVRDVALPIMREMRNQVNETIVLSVRTGDHRVHIESVESLQPMRRIAELGVQAPLYAGAASKVLLAGLEPAELEAYLARTKLVAFQPTTLTSARAIRRELDQIAEQGYAESRGELFAGGGSVAAPIRDFSGQTVAVIDILTPEHRYTTEHRDRCIAVLIEATTRISKRLGFEAQTVSSAKSRS